MKKSYEHIAELIIKHQDDAISETEEMQLNHWRGLSPENEACFKNLNNQNYLMKKLIVYASADSKRIWELTQRKIRKARWKEFAYFIFAVFIRIFFVAPPFY